MPSAFIKKVFLSWVLILGTIITAYLFSVISQTTYITTDNEDDKCDKVIGVPGDVAESLISGSQSCRVTNKGSFQEEIYIRVVCKSKEDDSQYRHIFGSKEACSTFKTLTADEYIKLQLTTWISPEVDGK